MITNLYKDHVFYIPTFLEFKGRIYPILPYFNYKGGDMARSLFKFYLNPVLNHNYTYSNQYKN